MTEFSLWNAPILIGLAGLAAVAAGVWTIYGQLCGQGKKSRPTHVWVISVFAVLTLVVGGVATVHEGEARNLEMRADLLHHTESIVAMMRAEDVRQLTFSARDSTNAVFQCVCAQLSAYAKAVGHRGIYTQALREGRTVFGPESLSEMAAVASPPGTPCRPPTAANRELFRNGAALTEGPVGCAPGVVVSALAPVKDARTGEVLMAVGMDVDWKEWRQAIARARLPAVLLTCLVLLILAAGGEVLRWQGRADEPLGRTAPWVEAAVVVGIGLAVTLAAAGWAHVAEGRLFREAFIRLAEARGKIVADSLADVRDFRLEGLAGFLQASPEVSRQQFRQYVAPLNRDGFAQAWEWVPAVPAAARTQLEGEARRDGFADFGFYEKDTLGQRIPAANRACYYPVFYVEPVVGNVRALGYDLGSETLRKTALEAATRVEAAIATDPITLVQETSPQKGVLVCRAVFTETVPRRLQGFAVLVLRLGTLLQAALERTGHDRAAVLVDLFQLFPNKEPLLIVSSLSGTNGPPAVVRQPLHTRHAVGHVLWPCFAFGNAYVLAMAPGPAFLSSYPRRSAWAVMLVGMVATFGGAALVGFVSSNRNYLKAQMRARTARLSQSEARLRLITDSAQDAILMLSPEGGISYWNPAAERIFGYTSAEALGQNLHTLLAFARYSEADESARPELWRGGAGPAVGKTIDLEGRRKGGQEIALQLSVSAVQVEDRWQGVVVLRDVTERKQLEAELQAGKSRFDQLAEQSRTFVWEVNAAGRYTFVSPVAKQVLGYGPEELMGQRYFYDLHPEAGREEFQQAAFAVFARKEPFTNLVNPVLTKDGRTLWVATNGVPLLNPDGTLCGYHGSDTDITARKLAEDEIKRQAGLIHSLLNSIPDIVFFKNAEGVYLGGNPAFVEFVGRSGNEIVGKTDHELFVDNSPA